MKTSTSPLISELQNKNFTTKSSESINGKDLNYEGHTLTDTKSFVLSGYEAVKNKVLLWLASSAGDYVREPDKGGVLYGLLGSTLTESKITNIKQQFTSMFTENFKGEISLVSVDVVANKRQKRWDIVLVVQDPLRHEIFDIAVGIEA